MPGYATRLSPLRANPFGSLADELRTICSRSVPVNLAVAIDPERSAAIQHFSPQFPSAVPANSGPLPKLSKPKFETLKDDN
jgi:hypothetical protein